MNKKLNLLRLIVGAALLAAMSLLVLSCPNPLSETAVTRAKDRLGPTITVLTPSDSSVYKASMTVTGTAVDLAVSRGAGNGSLKTLSYEIVPSALTGEITVGDDGGFSFGFSTIGMAGDIVVVLTATDWNNNVTEESLKLTGDSDGPYITLTSPADLSFYGSQVEVRGVICNSKTDEGTSEVASFGYQVVNTSIEGEVEFEDNGSFTVSFSTSGLSGLVMVQFTAAPRLSKPYRDEKALFALWYDVFLLKSGYIYI